MGECYKTCYNIMINPDSFIPMDTPLGRHCIHLYINKTLFNTTQQLLSFIILFVTFLLLSNLFATEFTTQETRASQARRRRACRRGAAMSMYWHVFRKIFLVCFVSLYFINKRFNHQTDFIFMFLIFLK